MYNISQKYVSRLIFFTKILILAGAYYMIYTKIIAQGSFKSIFAPNNFSPFKPTQLLFLFMIISMTGVNWLLEVLKWKYLTTNVQSISTYEALKQSLASLTASLITPNRLGEYGAKAVYYPAKERPRILVLNFLSNFSQMMTTMIFGIFGMIILWDKIPFNAIHLTPLKGLGFVIAGIILLVVLFKNKFIRFFHNGKDQFLQIPFTTHKKALSLSLMRYIVFSHQFYLLLYYFGIDIPYSTAMPVIFTMYFISSAIPGFVVFDWLVKGSVAVALFALFGINEIAILSITSLMWMLNFAVPSFIGSFFVVTFNGSSLFLKESRVEK